MESPIDEESLLTERESNNSRSRRARDTLRRKMVLKRSYPWLLAPQYEDAPLAKMPRLLALFPITVEEAVAKTALLYAEEAIRFAYVNVDPMTTMQLNTSATRTPPSTQRKHNTYKEYIKERPALATMAPVPTSMHLSGLYPSIHQTNGFPRMWRADQINLLRILNGMNGYASTLALDPIQTTNPCWDGWSPRGSACHTTITQATGLTGLSGMGTVSQDNILETQQRGKNGKNGFTSLALDPFQTTVSPCRKKNHKAMDTAPADQKTGWTPEEVDIDWSTERKGKWTVEEDAQLLRAAEMFAVTRWKAIAALIPGRTKKQCWNRWQYALDPSTARKTERKGKWLKEEDDKLVVAVEKYKGKNWDEVAKLVPSRTKRQCMDRWHKVLDTSIC
jgi:hypothetical protein